MCTYCVIKKIYTHAVLHRLYDNSKLFFIEYNKDCYYKIKHFNPKVFTLSVIQHTVHTACSYMYINRLLDKTTLY